MTKYETLDQIALEDAYNQEQKDRSEKALAAQIEQEQRQKSPEEEAVQEQHKIPEEVSMAIIYTLEGPKNDAYTTEKNHEVGCGCCRDW